MERILRSRILDAGDEIDSGYSPCPDAGVAAVGITAVTTTYPTAAGSFYAIHPAEVDGDPPRGPSRPTSTIPRRLLRLQRRLGRPAAGHAGDLPLLRRPVDVPVQCMTIAS
jgi:hypothetical protein